MRIICFVSTSARGVHVRLAALASPGARQSAAGERGDAPGATRTVRKSAPRIVNVDDTPYAGMRYSIRGAVTRGERPKPMTTTPLASPFRSGNHRTAVGTGGGSA